MTLNPDVVRALRDDVHARCFAPDTADSRAIGAEVELLALDVATNRPVPLEATASRALIPILRRYGVRHGWVERPAPGGMTKFEIPGRAIVSFEPGGQIEISSVPHATLNALIHSLHEIVTPLRAELLDEGIALESVGIDPFNDAPRVPLQLHSERYERMTAYFDRIGPFGIRMMRQTAAIQVSLDRGVNPAARWRLLNDLAPYLIAIFANSARHDGAETGHRSFRAHCWRQLDPSRTGVAAPSDDAAGEYVAFALSANEMMRTAAGSAQSESPESADSVGSAAETYRPFAWWLERDRDVARWTNHLTTLFPEVRPRGHFEVRSCDAIPIEWYAVPIVMLSALTYDLRASLDAAVLAAESRVLLRRAGEVGLADAAIARTSRDLLDLTLQGARRMGDRYISGELLDTCDEFRRRFTARDACPGDEANFARTRTVRSRSSRV